MIIRGSVPLLTMGGRGDTEGIGQSSDHLLEQIWRRLVMPSYEY
jgi:hypothetical protein